MILKKYFSVIGLCTLLLLIKPNMEQSNIFSSAVLEDKSTICNSNNLYQDIFLTFLKPYTDTSINNFYKDYLTISPIEDPWFVKILSIESPKHLEFIIKLEVAQYIGPHNCVGIDHITFKLKIIW